MQTVMLDAEQVKLATEKLSRLKSRLELVLDRGPDPEDRFSKALDEFVQQIARAAGPSLEVVPATGPPDRYPSLQVGNIKYLAVPLDRELEPFLDVLVYLANGVELELPEPARDPARLDLLVAPTCPNCPTVVRACGQVAAVAPQLTMTVIDVQFFTELAGSCRSVPTLIIDGAYTVVGPISTPELVELLERRRQPGYLAVALASMLEAGRLSEIGPLLQSEDGAAALASIMRDGSMQQKMGLMLAVEEVLETQPHALDGAAKELIPLLSSEVVTVRGDVADLLGRIGTPGARDALSRLLQDENPDVREAAEEALSLLRSPS
jgi:hypothetical protein